MDEVFGEGSFVSQIAAAKTSGLAASGTLAAAHDYVLHYSKNKSALKYRELFIAKIDETEAASEYFNLQLSNGLRRRMLPEEREDPKLLSTSCRIFRVDNLTKPARCQVRFHS